MPKLPPFSETKSVLEPEGQTDSRWKFPLAQKCELVLRWIFSISLSIYIFCLLPYPLVRMLRTWTGKDNFQRHVLNLTVDGIRAKWGFSGRLGDLSPLHEDASTPPAQNQNTNGRKLEINGFNYPEGLGTQAPSKISSTSKEK